MDSGFDCCGMTRDEDDGVDAVRQRLLDQGRLLDRVIGCFGHVMRGLGAETRSHSVGSQTGAGVGGIEAVLGEDGNTHGSGPPFGAS